VQRGAGSSASPSAERHIKRDPGTGTLSVTSTSIGSGFGTLGAFPLASSRSTGPPAHPPRGRSSGNLAATAGERDYSRNSSSSSIIAGALDTSPRHGQGRGAAAPGLEGPPPGSKSNSFAASNYSSFGAGSSGTSSSSSRPAVRKEGGGGGGGRYGGRGGRYGGMCLFVLFYRFVRPQIACAVSHHLVVVQLCCYFFTVVLRVVVSLLATRLACSCCYCY
jgi:hypothetical protein